MHLKRQGADHAGFPLLVTAPGIGRINACTKLAYRPVRTVAARRGVRRSRRPPRTGPEHKATFEDPDGLRVLLVPARCEPDSKA